jgi:DNA-binding response OmpR family regulator
MISSLVLVVEDDEEIATLLERYLARGWLQDDQSLDRPYGSKLIRRAFHAGAE